MYVFTNNTINNTVNNECACINRNTRIDWIASISYTVSYISTGSRYPTGIDLIASIYYLISTGNHSPREAGRIAGPGRAFVCVSVCVVCVCVCVCVCGNMCACRRAILRGCVNNPMQCCAPMTCLALYTRKGVPWRLPGVCCCRDRRTGLRVTAGRDVRVACSRPSRGSSSSAP